MTEMGIVWDEDNFWKAISRGDDRAVSLFLRGGMTVDPPRLHALLKDRTATRRASLKLLAEHGATLGGEFCSTDEETGQPHRSVIRFAEYSRDEVALQFVRQFCAGRDISAPLASRLRLERERLDAARAENLKLSEAQSACAKDVAAEFRYKSGRRFAALKTALFEARTCTDDAFPQGILRGYCEVNLKAMNDKCPTRSSCAVEEITAAEYCAARFPARQIDESFHNALEAAVAAYSRQMTGLPLPLRQSAEATR